MEELGCPDTKEENLKSYSYTIKNRGFNILLKDCTEDDGSCLNESELSEKKINEMVQIPSRDFFIDEEAKVVGNMKIDLSDLPVKTLTFKPKDEKPENDYEKILVSIAAKSRHLLYLTLCETIAENYYNYLNADTEEAKAKFKKNISIFREINKNNPFVKSAHSPELTLLNPVCFVKNHYEYKFFNSLAKPDYEEEPGTSLAECLRGLAFSNRID